MEQLPSLLARSALPLVAALALTRPASAQMPVSPSAPEPEPQAAPEPAPDSPPVLDPLTAPAPALLPPPAPPAPPAATSGSNPPPSASQPGPAKADQLKQPATAGIEAAPVDEDEEDEEGRSTETRRRTWYGWQTLTADGISTVVFFSALTRGNDGSSDPNETLAWAGLIGYEFAPGIVHFAHKNPGRAFASFGIRLGMPLAGAFLGGAAASGCSGYECEAGGAGIGFLLGMGGAIAIDAAVLAYESREPRSRSARVRPVVSLATGRAWLGVAGEL